MDIPEGWRVIKNYDMESGEEGWSTINSHGGWHLSQGCGAIKPHEGSLFWYYGREDVCNYNWGLNWGELYSPSVDLSYYEDAMLFFWDWHKVERGTGSARYDSCMVQTITPGGYWKRHYWWRAGYNYNQPYWVSYPINLSDYSGSSFKIRFRFFSVDDWDNSHPGWAIDDVMVIGLPIHLTIEDLINETLEMNLQQGIENSLDKKLQSAQRALNDMSNKNYKEVINKLNAFINEVEAQRENKITNEQADTLIGMANHIIDLTGDIDLNSTTRSSDSILIQR